MPGTCLLEMRKSSSKPGAKDGGQNGYLPNKDAPRLDHQLRSEPSGVTSNCVYIYIYMAKYVHRCG